MHVWIITIMAYLFEYVPFNSPNNLYTNTTNSMPPDKDWALFFHKRHIKGRCLLKAYKAHNPSTHWQCGTLSGTIVQTRVQWEEGSILSKALKLWYHDKVYWTLLFHKRHLKRICLLKAYKTHNPGMPWQCGTLNMPPHMWHYCPNTCTTKGKTQHCPKPWSFDTMIKFIEPYSSTKMHFKGRCLLKAYKPHNPGIPWQCRTLNTPSHVWHLSRPNFGI
jgi:hypothetical protein